MSNITNMLNKLEAQVERDALKIKKLERVVQKKDGWQIVFFRFGVIFAFTELFLLALNYNIERQVVAAFVPAVGYLVLEFVVRLYKLRISKR